MTKLTQLADAVENARAAIAVGDLPDSVIAATAEAIGSAAYDYAGHLLTQNDAHVAEIARAAIESYLAATQPAVKPSGEAIMLHFVFDRIPDAHGANFIEVETAAGVGIKAGEWRTRDDGYAELVVDPRGFVKGEQPALATTEQSGEAVASGPIQVTQPAIDQVKAMSLEALQSDYIRLLEAFNVLAHNYTRPQPAPEAVQLVCDALIAIVAHSGSPGGMAEMLTPWRARAEEFTRNYGRQQPAPAVPDGWYKWAKELVEASYEILGAHTSCEIAHMTQFDQKQSAAAALIKAKERLQQALVGEDAMLAAAPQPAGQLRAWFRRASEFGPWIECKSQDDGAVLFSAPQPKEGGE